MSLKVNRIIEYEDKDLNFLMDIAEKVCEECLSDHGDTDFIIGIMITDDKSVRELNKEYRKIDKETDVLSFPMLESGPEGIIYDELDKDPDFNAVLLGDIVLSYDRILSQASEYNHNIERETAFLASHGMLHLLGFSHDDEEQEKNMRNKQESVLQNLGYIR